VALRSLIQMKLTLVFKHLVILTTFYLQPTKESIEPGSIYKNSRQNFQGTWSSCSKSCNGGVQWKMRNNGTREWRVCVSSPCPVLSSSGSGITWADRLCARHKLGYQFGQWLSFVRSDNPCHLMCKDVTKPGAFRHLSSSVMDGVRCNADSGTLNVCLHGQCRTVGCDLIIGSGARLDECGVCDGRGGCNKQKNSRFSWTDRPSSQCSVTCGGGGRQSVTYVCRDTVTRAIVDQDHCDQETRPAVDWINCGDNSCDSLQGRSHMSSRATYWSDDYDEDIIPIDEDENSRSYENFTHLADYLETAGTGRMKLSWLIKTFLIAVTFPMFHVAAI